MVDGGTAMDPEVISQLLSRRSSQDPIHIGNIFAKLGLAASDSGHRRVLATLTYLRS